MLFLLFIEAEVDLIDPVLVVVGDDLVVVTSEGAVPAEHLAQLPLYELEQHTGMSGPAL